MAAGFYERRIFPWLLDRLSKDRQLQELRAETLAPARGNVVEVGFGTGLNLPFYSSAVTAIAAVEPNEGMIPRAAKRVAESHVPVKLVPGAGEKLPFEERSFDTAVLTLTLCSVADPAAVLGELHRVLRDDGALLILEHGRSEEPRVMRWQDRLNPLQRIIGCGCNINRPVADLVERSGFRFETLRKFYAPHLPRTHGWITAGVAKRVR